MIAKFGGNPETPKEYRQTISLSMFMQRYMFNDLLEWVHWGFSLLVVRGRGPAAQKTMLASHMAGVNPSEQEQTGQLCLCTLAGQF